MSDNPQPPQEAAFFTAIREWGLVRETGGMGGVTSGLGSRIGLAPAPARLLTVLAAVVLTGPVLLAYGAAWGLLPDRHGRIIIQDFGRGITNVGALLGIAILSIVGLIFIDDSPLLGIPGVNWAGGAWGHIGDTFGFFAVLAPLALLIGATVIVVTLIRRKRDNATDFEPTRYSSADTDAPAPASAAHATSTPADSGAASHSTSPQYAQPPVTRTAAATAPPASAGPRPPAYDYHYKPKPPGPGKPGWLGFLGVLVVSAAIVLWLDRNGELGVAPLVAWGAAITIGLGAVLVVVALSGRRLGFLGFVSVCAVLLAGLFTVNADSVRDHYSSDWYGWAILGDGSVHVEYGSSDESSTSTSISAEPFDPAESTDATVDAFTDDYSRVVLPEYCMAGDAGHGTGEPSSALAVTDLTADETIGVGPGLTRITVAAGTNLVIEGTGTGMVIWEDRDVSCELWEHDGVDNWLGDTWISLVNPGEPTLTINSSNGGTIYIEEVAK
ncbi:PspC domain-containing protein [Demequina sediminicola]|uniref:PspC domain-containing protein n=1 Tax=Demequina sediminicola TaxID=1095026 RepID=UPI0007859C45|nr:PspC domain-containing protein [Demequina sediminicola]